MVGAWVVKVMEHIEIHCVLIWLFHNVSNLIVQIIYKSSCWVHNDLIEAFKANTAFSNISIEESDTNNNVR